MTGEARDCGAPRPPRGAHTLYTVRIAVFVVSSAFDAAQTAIEDVERMHLAAEDRAVSFYEKLGFQRFPTHPKRLFLPVATARRLSP